MRLRTCHLAGILLLLASLGVAEGSALREGGYTVGGHYIGVLLAQNHVTDGTQIRLGHTIGEALKLDIPVASLSQYRTTWTMRPPSSQSVERHAVTGSSL